MEKTSDEAMTALIDALAIGASNPSAGRTLAKILTHNEKRRARLAKRIATGQPLIHVLYDEGWIDRA